MSLNVLNTGKQAAGLISTLDSINGSRLDPSGDETRNIPIEIMVMRPPKLTLKDFSLLCDLKLALI